MGHSVASSRYDYETLEEWISWCTAEASKLTRLPLSRAVFRTTSKCGVSKKKKTTNDQNWCSAEKPNKSAQIELWSPTLKISAIFTVPAVVTVMFWPVSSLVLSLWLYLVDSLVLSLRLSLVDSSVFRIADLSTLSCSLWVQWHQDVFSLLAPAAKTLSFRRIETPCLTSWFHVWFMSLFIQLRARQAGSCSHLSALS